MADHLGLKVEPYKESFTFLDCSQRSSGGIVRDLEVQTGAVYNMQTNQLCLTLIDPHVPYDPIPVMKPHTSSKRIDDPGLKPACHFGAEYETEYSASIETHTHTSIDGCNQKSLENHLEESIDKEYNEYYEEERATEYRGIRTEEDRLLHHSYRSRNATSIDRNIPTSTDIAYYPSIDEGLDRSQEGNYLIGSWANDRYHESYAVEIAIHEPRAERSIPEHQQRVTNEFYNTAGEVDDRFKPKYRQHTRPSVDIGDPTSINRRP
ncbi:hypothetical protein F2Q70_00020532 [Brassica cretica]|uniref:Uncharacterized protein n=1 Tax=Brassica cretica TaxID=69181 RepID=A0A8S9GV90_BRACR|nr:hypothetical protein F2Q70_00020532 [Brassica cretica]